MEISIKKVKFSIKGIAPLLMDRMFDSKAKTGNEYEKEAPFKMYLNDKKLPSIMAIALKACIRDASSELGKKFDGKKNRRDIKAGLFITPEYMPIGKKTYDEIHQAIGVRGKGDKVTRVKIYRPMFKDWSISGEMSLFAVEPSFVKEALELGGFKYGIYGNRPEYGRFVVEKFEEVG